MGYRTTLKWHRKGVPWITTSYGETLEESLARNCAAALASGWRPKKWWQFWRWADDTPDIVAALVWFHKTYSKVYTGD